MNDRFNPIPVPTTGPAAEKYAVGLLGDLLGPLGNKLVYRVDSALDKAKSDAIDKVLGNNFSVSVLKETNDLYAITGNPVVGSIQFKKGRYKNFATNGSVYYEEVERDYTLPYSTICTFDRAKIDAITDLRGQYGSVKELFGFGDWHVQIRGFIMRDGHDGEPNQDSYNPYIFPNFSMSRMRNFCDLADSIEVGGGLMGLFRIKRLYLRAPSFQEVEGKPHILAYSIQALSDRQLEINIKP